MPFGGVAFRPRFYLTTRTGQRLQDVSAALAGGSVTWNEDQDTYHATLTVTAQPAGQFNRLADYLQPVAELTYDDGRVVVEPMGIYRIVGISSLHTSTGSSDTLTAYDLVYELSNSKISIPYTIPAGSDPLTYVKSNLNYIGFSVRQFAFPGVSRPTTADFVYPPGTSRQQFINDMFAGLGWYYIWMNRYGKFTTRPSLPLSSLQPVTTYTAGDLNPNSPSMLYPSITNDTDDSRLCNIVTVRNITPGGPAIWYSAINDDSTSDIAYTKVGRIALPPEDNPQITTKAEAQARAEQLLTEGASYLRKVTIATQPDPFFDLHDAVGLSVKAPDGSVYYDGIWWRRTTTFPLSPEGWSSGQTMDLNRIDPFVITGSGAP